MSWKVRDILSKKRTISLGDFLDALEENGLPQAHAQYWSHDNKRVRSSIEGEFEVGAACAIGQAALNLGTHYHELEAIMQTKFKNSKNVPLTSSIISRNDGSRWGIKQIARFYRRRFSNRLDETFDINVRYEVIKD